MFSFKDHKFCVLIHVSAGQGQLEERKVRQNLRSLQFFIKVLSSARTHS